METLVPRPGSCTHVRPPRMALLPRAALRLPVQQKGPFLSQCLLCSLFLLLWVTGIKEQTARRCSTQLGLPCGLLAEALRLQESGRGQGCSSPLAQSGFPGREQTSGLCLTCPCPEGTQPVLGRPSPPCCASGQAGFS